MNRGCRGNELHQALDNSLVIALNSMRGADWEDVDFGLLRMESLYALYTGPTKERGSQIPDAIFVYKSHVPELEKYLWPLFSDHFYFLIEIGEADAGKWPDHNWLHIGFDGNCTFRFAAGTNPSKDRDVECDPDYIFLKYAIGAFAQMARECVQLNAPNKRKSRPTAFKKCSKGWSMLGDSKSLSRIRNYGRASFYLGDRLWMHPCGQCNEEEDCGCGLCREVHHELTAMGVFDE